MNIYDAAKILGLEGQITAAEVKAAFMAAAKKYHPDINPAGGEMMKLVNAAYDVLKGDDHEVNFREDQGEPGAYPEALNEALNAIIALAGLDIEICGAWVWVSGDTKTHKDALKAAGFKYASKKKMWFFRPEGFKSHSRRDTPMSEIRANYGSTKPGYFRPALGGRA